MFSGYMHHSDTEIYCDNESNEKIIKNNYNKKCLSTTKTEDAPITFNSRISIKNRHFAQLSGQRCAWQVVKLT